MSFLNKKEDVLDIQLTSLGKRKVANGNFKPTYYAFFDDDVLYETRFAGYKEIANSSSVRIKETPTLEAQSHYAGVETEIVKHNDLRRVGESGFVLEPIQVTPDKHYALTSCLGTMSIEADRKPAWSVNVLKGEISDTSTIKQSTHPNEQIPQINLKDVEFTIRTKQGLEDDDTIEDGETFSDLDLINEKFEDGSYVDITEREIVLEVLERNTDYLNENFDMEIFEITSGSIVNTEQKEVLVPFYFQKRPSLIINDLLVDEADLKESDFPAIDGSFVENYFDVEVDSDIPETSLCNLNPVNGPDGVRGQRELNCINPDRNEFQVDDIYRSFVTQENAEEDC